MLILFLLALCGAGLALAGEPSDQIRLTTDKLLAIVQIPELQGPEKEIERRKMMREAVNDRFDWAAMARSALGKNWRNLSEAQRAEFTSLFSDLIEKTYMSQVDSYTSEKIVYKGDKVDGPYGVVDAVVVTLRGTDIPVSYRVLKNGAEWLVYDISIEGVSMVNNYRSQITSIMNNSTYDNLIAKIKAKINTQSTESADEKPEAKKARKQKEGTL